MLKPTRERIDHVLSQRYHFYQGFSDELIMLSRDFRSEEDLNRNLEMKAGK